MAITKERLEELIKEDKTIYFVNNYYNEIELIFLNKKCEINDEDEVYDKNAIYLEIFDNNSAYKITELYETKEEAEFVLKFHTSKTVYFKPPTWEEFLETETDIRRPNYTCENVMIIDYDNEILVEDYNNDLNEKYFNYDKELNNCKEKYYEAVEYAKNLFLGE